MLSDSVAEAFGLIHRHPRVKIFCSATAKRRRNLAAVNVYLTVVSVQLLGVSTEVMHLKMVRGFPLEFVFLNFLKNPVKRRCGATRSKGKMVRTASESTNQQEFVKNTSNLLRFTGRQEVHIGV